MSKPSKSKREIGDELERHIQRILDLTPTRGSGNQLDDADLKDHNMIVECKVKNGTKGVSIPESQLTKLNKQANKWRKEWAFVTMNSDGNIFVTVNIDWFRQIYEGYLNQENSTIDD